MTQSWTRTPSSTQRHFWLDVRDKIEPSLSFAGFQFDERNNPRNRFGSDLWIDYRRGAHLFSIRWDRWVARLAAETMDDQGNVEVIADVIFDKNVRSHEQLMSKVDPFVEKIKKCALGHFDESQRTGQSLNHPPQLRHQNRIQRHQRLAAHGFQARRQAGRNAEVIVGRNRLLDRAHAGNARPAA